MGVDWITMTLAVPREREIDWDGLARAVTDVDLEPLYGAASIELFETVFWDMDGSTPRAELPSVEGGFVSLRQAQAQLRWQAGLLRSAIEAGSPDLLEIPSAAHRIWFTGGTSVGDSPNDLVAELIEFAESGVLEAAGFTHWSPCDIAPPAERKWSFSRSEVHQINVGTALAHVAMLAAHMEHPVYEPPRIWLDALAGELPARREDFTGEALVRVLARVIAAEAWIRDPADRELTATRLDAAARDMARRIDADGWLIGDAPFGPRKHETAWDRLASLMKYSRNSWPDAHADRASLRDLIWPLLANAANALVNLHRTRVYPLLGLPSETIAGASEPCADPGSDVSLWMLLDDGCFDWDAAEQAAAAAGPDLVGDLASLRVDVHTSNYPFSMSERFDGIALYVGLPHWHDDLPDSARALERLAAAGVIDAGGPTWYFVPESVS